MGGTGNTGAEPKAQFGPATSVEGTGAPGWAAPAAAPAAAPVESTQPPALRPYELVDASTGSGATTAPNLGFPTAAPPAANPMGFSHEPYPVAPTEVPTYAGAAPPVVTPTATPEAPKSNPDDYVFVYKPPTFGSNGLPMTSQAATDAYNYYGVYGQAGMKDATSINYGMDPAAAGGTWMNPSSPSMQGWYGSNAPIAGKKPGDLLTAGDTSVPRMKKSLYDFNMTNYGNPYGPGILGRDQDMYSRTIQEEVDRNRGGSGG